MAPNLVEALRLVLVTDDGLLSGRDLVACCRDAELGGVTAVQLRLKRAPACELADLARTLLRALSVPLFVNDRLDVALAVGAAGVHLGPDDVPVALARQVAPSGFWIGASVGSVEEGKGADGADYWGVGPLRPTATKADAGLAIGIDRFVQVARSAPREVPCVAIGGVQPEDGPAVRAAGGTGVAVAGGILRAQDITAAARRHASA